MLTSFWKPEAGSQTVLPENQWIENVKLVKFKWDIFGDFPTMCVLRSLISAFAQFSRFFPRKIEEFFLVCNSQIPISLEKSVILRSILRAILKIHSMVVKLIGSNWEWQENNVATACQCHHPKIFSLCV